MEEIGGDIDFCLIDTMHTLPGEILDFLMIFPYLKDNATLVLHDTNLHLVNKFKQCTVNSLLISALSGNKLILETINFPNIAGVELKAQKDFLWNIFNLLTQRWYYTPNEHDIALLTSTFQKHYDPYFVNMFTNMVDYQQNSVLKSKYLRYKILSKILFGKRRKRYEDKLQNRYTY